jgi:hypothetical protein
MSDDQQGGAVPVSRFEAEYREMLAQQTIAELRTLAKNRGFPVQGTRKDPIVAEMAAQLSNPDAISAQIRALDEPHRELLSYIHLTVTPGYGVSTESIVDSLLRQGKTERRSAIYSQILDLSSQGLLLPFKHYDMVYYILPRAVRACVPPHPDLVAAYPADKLGELETHQFLASTAIQKLYAIWSYVAERQPRRMVTLERLPAEDEWPHFHGWSHLPTEIVEITQRRRHYYNLNAESVTVPPPAYHLSTPDRQALRNQEGYPDEEIEFWYVILESLGAISGEPGEMIAAHEEAFQQLLSLSPSAQMQAILQTWTDLPSWSEIGMLLRSSEDIRLRRALRYTSFKPQDLYQDWLAGRQAVLRFLSVLQEGQWLSTQSLLKTVFEIVPNLIHMMSDRSVWWFESLKTRKQFGTTFEEWQQSYGLFVMAVLEGPLAWLGAVSLGYRERQAVAFQLTPVASLAFGRRANLVETPGHAGGRDAVKMHDDMTVRLAPGRTPAQLHDLLHLLGELEEATPEQFTYRITANGVLQALEQGYTLERIDSSLNRWTRGRVPAAWQEKMRTWSQNYGKLHIYDEVTLIELADEYALQELMVNTSLREHLIYQFSPHLVAVAPEAVPSLVQEMEKRGYTPRVE